jgi:prolyl-tRNA editing enzyme YbaK/EbsC (Cys-tRNA(Pro) deacylase)
MPPRSRLGAVSPAPSIGADLGVAALLARHDLAPVEPDESPGLTGYLLQFVPPVALECPATLLVDERLAGQDVVYTAAGEPGVILKVRGADLIKATSAVVASITRQAN